MSRISDQSYYERKLVIQPIKLKSINKERAFTRTFKLSKSFSLPLTDQKFEKQINELEQLRFHRKDQKFDSVSLKSEIANATSKALQSVHNYSLSKERINFRSSRRLNLKGLYTADNSPVVTERANLSGYLESSSLLKQDTPKASTTNKNLQLFKGSPKGTFPYCMKENELNPQTEAGKETRILENLKAATLKLREIRLRLYKFK